MKVVVRKRFFKNSLLLRKKDLLDDLLFLFDLIDKAKNTNEIPGFKYLTGYTNYARIQHGGFRIGVLVQGDTITFICLLHRNSVYKEFP